MNSNATNKYVSDWSMGSQTEILPKMTYKELNNYPYLARITGCLEINECEIPCNSSGYLKKIVKVKIALPEQYKELTQNETDGKPRPCMTWIEDTSEYKWANHLPEPNGNDFNFNCLHNCDCKAVAINGVGAHQYRYTINSVVIINNKKYVKEEPRKAPRQRRPKPMDEIPALAQEKVDPKIELNRQMEEIQKQMEEIQGQKAEAEKVYITACLQHAEARKAVEETLVLQREANWKRTELLQKDGKIKTELENVKKELEKIEIEKNQNKNGYIVLAHDDYGGKEEVYGHARTYRAAKTIANEAVETGKCRKNINGVKYDDDCIEGEKVEALWNGDGKWYSATITKVFKSQKKYDVEWDDQTTSSYLHEKKIKKITKHKRFDSARIVDLDTQAEVEEFGQYIDGASW